MKRALFFVAVIGAFAACEGEVPPPSQPLQTTGQPPVDEQESTPEPEHTTMSDNTQFEVNKSDEEWANELTPQQFEVLRQHGTERAFTGKYYKHKDNGMYVCAGCGNELFKSDEKYESGSGWPSFWQPKDSTAVEEQLDKSFGMMRREVHCSRCGGHLGHVFEDGPQPTGLRYCINSASLDFKQEQ